MITMENSGLLTLHGEQMKLDLGCGDNKKAGFAGVDKFKTASTDVLIDLLVFPWVVSKEDDLIDKTLPLFATGNGDEVGEAYCIPDCSVDEVHCSHFFEHVPKEMRARFMEELHRIMKPGATATFITPCGDRALQDATHEWPPIVAGSYLYFNKKWRDDNKLQHGFYDIKADFDYTYGYGLTPEVAARNAEYQAFAVANYKNAVTDLHVTLTKK